MELKEEVLQRLESARGEYISGEQLAEQLGVSRNAVWKCVKRLEKDGFAISSVKNRGYAVLPESDALSAVGIEKFLPEGFGVKVLKKAASTNDEVKSLAAEGAPPTTSSRHSSPCMAAAPAMTSRARRSMSSLISLVLPRVSQAMKAEAGTVLRLLPPSRRPTQMRLVP